MFKRIKRKYKVWIENIIVFVITSTIILGIYHILVKSFYLKDLEKYQNNSGNSKNASSSFALKPDDIFLIGKHIPSFNLVTLDGKKFNSDLLVNKLWMIILFNPFDCSSCLSEAQFWQKIYEKYSNKNFSVIGIADGPRQREIKIFAKRKNLTFEICLDLEGKIKNELGINISPVVLLLSKNGIIKYNRYSTGIKDENYQFMKFINKFIESTK